MEKLSYKSAGVDIDKANLFIKEIEPFVSSTFRPEVIKGIGGFGGFFSLNLSEYKKPVLIASVDGVGTKLKVAEMAGFHKTVGIDLVAMCVNDIIVYGAEPLFMLDYIGTGQLSVKKAKDIIEGIVYGCKEAGCSLIGGETAEMPSFYHGREYDLVGFVVGIVENDEMIDGSLIKVGDKIVGVASSGLHSNGFSLVRKLFFEKLNIGLDDEIEGIGRLKDELLRPTKIYVKTVKNLIRDFKISGIAHITGGGLLENIPRMLPDECMAVIEDESWEIPPIFQFIRKEANLEREEMYRTFNCGIGLVLVVGKDIVEDVLSRLLGLGEKAYIIGEVKKRKGEKAIEFV